MPFHAVGPNQSIEGGRHMCNSKRRRELLCTRSDSTELADGFGIFATVIRICSINVVVVCLVPSHRCSATSQFFTRVSTRFWCFIPRLTDDDRFFRQQLIICSAAQTRTAYCCWGCGGSSLRGCRTVGFVFSL